MKRASYWSLALLLIVVISSCKDKKEDDTKEEFKKEEILSNLADNYIIPGYADLQTRLNTLSDSWNNFVNSPSQTTLDAVRADWQTANVSFHRVKLVEIGPAMTVGLSGSLGTFPADTAQIQANINAGTYNLLSVENTDAIGFESLDFLLYGFDCLNKLTTSAPRRAYVTDVIAKMRSEVNQVVSDWATYRAMFIAGTGTSSTSPFSLLVNYLCKDFELAKSAKLGIPIGTQSLGIQQPAYLEARRSGFGRELLQVNMEAVHAVFLGESLTGSNGQGFDDYLTALDRGNLSSTIDARLASLETQQSGWSGTIEDMMASSPSALMDYYNYMQGTVVYLKTDMAAAFGVLITYQDGDGD